jgi:branched-subunit amino acid aminotransferase/4-amino-4-deoxychorismate lyase
MTPRTTLLETIRIRDGAAPLWGLHLARLYRSCKELGVPPPMSLEVPGAGRDRVRRIAVSAHGVDVSERGVGSTEPVNLVTSSTVHPRYTHKTTQRAAFDEAIAAARRAGADDALLLTEEGWVTECGIWTLFWWEDGAVTTPPLDLGVLPGVARARIAALAPLRERRVPRGTLEGRALFVANAARGIVRVGHLDGEAVPTAPATDALAAGFWG